MSASSPSSLGWFDVTGFVLSAASSLPVGHFLSSPSPSFSLHAAMSALELMDPRMDPSFHHPTHGRLAEQQRRVASAEEQRRWSDSFALHCSDALLCCVATHLSGVSLPHSLYSFTLLHHHPYEQLSREEDAAEDEGGSPVFPLLVHPLLSLLSRLSLHLSLSFRALVSRADVYEEDEWSMHSFNARIEQRGGGEELGREATAAEQRMEAELKAAKKRPSTGGGDRGEGEGVAAAALQAALLSRLRALHSLLLLFSHLAKAESSPPSKSTAAVKLLTRASTHLLALASSPQLSPSSSYHRQLADFLASPSCPFDPSIASSLILHAPPRSYPLLSLTASLALLQQLLVHTGQVLSASSLRTLPSLLSFLSAFSQQGPNIVARSLLLLRCVDDADDVCRSSLSLQRLLSAAIEELSPSTAIYFHPQLQAALFHPPASRADPASPPVSPSPELLSSFFGHLSSFVCGHMRLLLMDATKVKAKVASQLQLLTFLLQAAESVDQWMAHLSLTVLDWPPPSQSDCRALLFDGGFQALVFDFACQTLLLFLARHFAAELLVERELQLAAFLQQRWSQWRLNNRQRAWRDHKLVPLLLSQHLALLHSASSPSPSPPPAAAAAARKRTKALLSSASPSPPLTGEWLLLEAWTALSAGTSVLIHALQRTPRVVVPSFTPSQLPVYFASRFAALTALKSPALPLSDSLAAMSADLAALPVDAALALSGQQWGRAKEALVKLGAHLKEHPTLPNTSLAAMTATAPPPSAASSAASPSPSPGAPSSPAPAVEDWSTWTLLPVDAAFVRSLLVVCVSNAVTALSVRKLAVPPAASPQTDRGADRPPLLSVRFSFQANAVFPLISVAAEPAQRQPRTQTVDGEREKQ